MSPDSAEVLEAIAKFIQGAFETDIVALDERLGTEELSLKDCEKAPVLGHPGVNTLVYEGKVVGIQRDRPEILQ